MSNMTSDKLTSRVTIFSCGIHLAISAFSSSSKRYITLSVNTLTSFSFVKARVPAQAEEGRGRKDEEDEIGGERLTSCYQARGEGRGGETVD